MLQTINYIVLSVIGLILMSVVLSELIDSLTNKKTKK